MFDGIAHGLETYMSLLAQRQKLVSANIANADTPGYKTKDIDFRSEFEHSLAGGRPDVKEVAGLPLKSDGNNVSLDRESRLLAENSLRFNIASNIVRSQLRSIRMALRDGRSE